MDTMRLRMALSGSDLLAILVRLQATQEFGKGVPTRLKVDDITKRPTADWAQRWTPGCKRDVFAIWGESVLYDYFLLFDRNFVVKAGAHDYARNAHIVLQLLTGQPFELASFASIHNVWSRANAVYSGPGFGDKHFPHGWACAFKGDGHRRLVSRRWLDYGPWRVLRGADDTTLVQFHDLEADAATALEQARPGHERMGISAIGGFIQAGYVYEHDVRGFYIPEERKLKVVVAGRDVTQVEMRDACAARYYQTLGVERPLDSIAYVFMEEAQARAHLHELWLRELECWATIGGYEVRLDVDYRPTPVKPEWVLRVEERERTEGP